MAYLKRKILRRTQACFEKVILEQHLDRPHETA